MCQNQLLLHEKKNGTQAYNYTIVTEAFQKRVPFMGREKLNLLLGRIVFTKRKDINNCVPDLCSPNQKFPSQKEKDINN